jgi:hypothetical protein
MDKTQLMYSIQTMDEEYQTLCKEKSLLYLPSLLLTILTSTKWSSCIDTILTNPFLKEFQCLLLKIVDHSVKLHERRRRFIQTWRKKRIPSCNTKDLSFSPFGKNRIELVIDSKKYTFHPHELQHLILSSLLHTEYYMIVEPLPIKNPYTGIPFTKPILYLLYLQLKMHPLFYYYTKVDFDLKQFLLQYEGLLRSHLIEKTILEYNETKLKSVCKKMLEEMTIYNFSTCEYEPIITIDKIKPHFLKSFILQYYHSLFSLNPYQREIEYKSLLKKLILLRDKEPDILMYLIP